MNMFSTILGGIFTGLLGTGNPVTDVVGLGGVLEGFFSTITNGKMWRSLGWLLLGLIIMGIGIVILVKGSVARVAGSAVKAAI